MNIGAQAIFLHIPKAGLILPVIPSVNAQPALHAAHETPRPPPQNYGAPMPHTPAPSPDVTDVAGICTHLHDIRGILSPALIKADLLSAHPDAQVRAGAEVIIQAIEATVGRLDLMRRTCLPARE